MTHAQAAHSPPATAAADDWRLRIPEPRRRALRAWLWSIAATTLAVLIVGGITRLTQSGLSITDWDPIMGVIPPLNDAQWQRAFDAYRQFPEYQLVRRGMSLAEFKFIFFWEYIHRVLARLIGVVFLVPFVWFAARRYFNRQLAVRALLLFALGGMQGVMGWFMVQSGLVARPSVSHFRLAAHLSLAFIIFGGCIWLIGELRLNAVRTSISARTRRMMLRGIGVLGGLLALQVVWGAFVAGLRAGRFYNSFPLMGGRLVPRGLLSLEPGYINFFQNPISVQWTHRAIGTALTLAALAFAVLLTRRDADETSRRLGMVFLALMGVQYLLGVLTLMLAVPVSLGVIHQAAALIIFGVWVAWLHHARHLEPAG